MVCLAPNVSVIHKTRRSLLADVHFLYPVVAPPPFMNGPAHLFLAFLRISARHTF